MWADAIQVGKKHKLPPGAVFHIIAAYHRIDEKQPDLSTEAMLDDLYETTRTARCPAGHWEPGLGPCICEGKVH